MKTYFLILGFVSMVLPSLAQTVTERVNYGNDEPLVNIQPPSAATMMKAIDNPVGLFNGNPSFSHDLYTLKDGAIEIPISLTYNASGIKVAEEASWIGMGWDLNLGGMIVQNVIGNSDVPACFKRNLGYYQQGEYPSYIGIPYRPNDKYIYDTFFEDATKGNLQPDVYFYSFPGGSGKFFIDHVNDSVYQIDASRNLKIENLNWNGSHYTNWVITTEDGTKHYFTSYLYTEERDMFAHISSRTALLTATDYPNGQRITYSYHSTQNIQYNYSESQDNIITPAYGLSFNNEAGTFRNNEASSIVQEATIASITTTNYRIDFYKSDRQDYENGKRLDSLVVRPLNSAFNKRKCYVFDSEYVTSSDDGNHWGPLLSSSGFFNEAKLRKRLFLNAVYEKAIDGSSNERMEFEYYSPEELPLKTSLAIDYWGFYNGVTTNSGAIPAFYYLLNGQNVNLNNYSTARSGNRCVSSVCSVYGMLKTIRYPMGGTTVFQYEPHTYESNYIIPCIEDMQASASSTLVSNLYDKNGINDPEHTTITLNQGQSISVNATICRGNAAWSNLTGASIVIVALSGSTQVVSRWTLDPSEMGSEIRKNISLSAVSTSTRLYGVYLNLPNELGDQTTASAYHASIEASVYVRDASSSSSNIPRTCNIGGGVRIKQIDHYAGLSLSSPSQRTIYAYPSSGGRLAVPLAFCRTYNSLKYVQMRWFGSEISTTREESITEGSLASEVYLSSNPIHSAPYSSFGANVYYPEVDEYDYVDGHLEGHTKNKFIASLESSAQGTFQIVNTLIGKPTSIEVYDRSGTLKKKTTYSYTSQRVHYYRGISITDNLNRSPQFYTVNNGFSGAYLIENNGLTDYGNYTDRYTTIQYPIYSTRCLVEQQTTEMDGSLSVSESFTYDGQLQKKTVAATASDGKVYKITYNHPYDYSFTVANNMTSRHMLAPVLETIESVDGLAVDGQYTKYDSYSYGALLLPSDTYRLSMATPRSGTSFVQSSGSPNTSYYPYAHTSILQYDSKGNPLHVRQNGVDIVYIWGYGYQYPVAEIKGATYQQVSTALGVAPSSLSSSAVPNFTQLNSLRGAISNTEVTTYEWEPLYGIKKTTDPQGVVTYFDYDVFGRLVRSRDAQGNTIEQNIYHYSNQ